MDKERIIYALKKSAVVTAIAVCFVVFIAVLIVTLVTGNAWWLFVWIPVVAVAVFIYALFCDELLW